MDPALLRTIALETNEKGEADAQIALVARRMIDRNGQVQVNADDLPASMRALGGGVAVPMWKKFTVTAADINACEDFGGGDRLRVPITTLEPTTFLHAAAARPTAFFDGPGYVNGEMIMTIGWQVAGFDDPMTLFNSRSAWFDGPGIEDDISYLDTVDSLNASSATRALWLLLASQATPIIFYLHNDSYGQASDFQDLVTGGFNLWLLLSKLPA